MNFHTFDRPRPRVIVVSHERSGTHFLMNSIAKCYGYLAHPWINFDQELGMNFYDPQCVELFFGQFAGHPLANIVKLHHSYPFLETVIRPILRDFHIFYIYRDPRDVMVSYWKFMKQVSWREGPRTETCSEFIRMAPCGQMLRYQDRQEPTVIHRWLTHVEGWLDGVPDDLRHCVSYIRYRDLAHDYENVMRSLAPIFGELPIALDRPSLTENSILPNAGVVGSHKEYLTNADVQLFEEIAGPMMVRLGYREAPIFAYAQPALA